MTNRRKKADEALPRIPGKGAPPLGELIDEKRAPSRDEIDATWARIASRAAITESLRSVR